MTGKTNTHSDSVLNVLRGTTLTGFGSMFIALFTAAPTDTTSGTESTYGSDDRQTIAFADVPVNGTPTGRQILNTDAPSWAGWDGTSPETFVAAGLFSVISAGTLLYWADLTTNRTINTGETATFAIGAVIIKED